jgi:hypothetical protein
MHPRRVAGGRPTECVFLPRRTCCCSRRPSWSVSLRHDHQPGEPSAVRALANAFLSGTSYHMPDRTLFSGMNIIDKRMHMNFGDARI